MSSRNPLSHHLTKVPIAVKMLLLTLFISIALWSVLEQHQLQDLRRAFLTEVQRELNDEAKDDRRLFDQNVRTIHNATKLISIQKPFLDYLAQLP
ncbi:MAG: hypothetical protein GQ470_01520, partial [Gammaproteobacteria bacterium]|nr:hypothetical protein [Gammaproteobacteria bacterium]